MTVQTLKHLKNQKGFTLIELLVVIGILAILLAITLIAINPAHQFAQANNTKRRSDVLQILNAVGQYTAENKGQLPTEITGLAADTPTNFDSTTALSALCAKLVPVYIPALPTNPTLAQNDITDCGAATWDTGYRISRDANNRITVDADSTANMTDEGVDISVSR